MTHQKAAAIALVVVEISGIGKTNSPHRSPGWWFHESGMAPDMLNLFANAWLMTDWVDRRARKVPGGWWQRGRQRCWALVRSSVKQRIDMNQRKLQKSQNESNKKYRIVFRQWQCSRRSDGLIWNIQTSTIMYDSDFAAKPDGLEVVVPSSSI